MKQLIITKVSAQRRPGRYNIFIDEKYAFSASEKTVAEFVLLKGKELNDEQVEKIKQFDADAKASDLAAHFLSYEPRTIFEVLQYLKKHEISDEAANNAVNQLNELGYLDDQQYAKLFIKNNLRVGSDGPQSLLRKLTQKGVNPEISQVELDEVAEEDWIEVGQRVIKSVGHQVGKISQRELERKMRIKLLTHGFSSDLIGAVIDTMDLEEDEATQTEALKKQGIKAYKRFRNLAETERKFKMKKYLFSHGFSSGEIDAFLNGEIIALDELAEY